jgi:hypothetical protein
MTMAARVLFSLSALAFLLAACSFFLTDDSGPPPRSHDQWTALAEDIRTFERRIGFRETKNFTRFADAKDRLFSCGHVSRLYLPYSYQDPAIEWAYTMTEKECRALGKTADILFLESEAWGENETPVTTSMLTAPLDRVVYVLIHEDCHDQFELPHGIEEPLCNVIAYNAMTEYGEQTLKARPHQFEAVRRYATDQAKKSHMTVALYGERGAVCPA